MVFFNGKRKNGKPSGGPIHHVIRIGHYANFNYRKTKKENEKPFNYDSDEVKKQKLKTSQRHWCSFRSEVLDDYKGLVTPPSKTITEAISPEVWNEVIKVGWRAF